MTTKDDNKAVRSKVLRSFEHNGYHKRGALLELSGRDTEKLVKKGLVKRVADAPKADSKPKPESKDKPEPKAKNTKK